MVTVKELYNAMGKLVKKGKGGYAVKGQFGYDIHVPQDKDVIDERNMVEV